MGTLDHGDVTRKDDQLEEPPAKKQRAGEDESRSPSTDLFPAPPLKSHGVERLECLGGIFKKSVKLPVQPGKVPIYVMLQLDWLSDDGQSLRHKVALPPPFGSSRATRAIPAALRLRAVAMAEPGGVEKEWLTETPKDGGTVVGSGGCHAWLNDVGYWM
eukprot:Skav218412  [mRNA]  locus=scaffold1349:198127:200497:+ [translate_table: standard]